MDKVDEDEILVREEKTANEVISQSQRSERENVLTVFKEMVEELAQDERPVMSMLLNAHDVVNQKVPRLKKASMELSDDIVRWVHRGGKWRSFFVSVVGIMVLFALAGITAFSIFFAIATVNMILLAVVGFLAVFGAGLAFLTAIYIFVLSVAIFFISSFLLVSFFTVGSAAGWIAVCWSISVGVEKMFVRVQKEVRSFFSSKVGNYNPSG